MTKVLSEADQHTFERDGFAFPISVLSPPEAERFRAACDELEAQLGGKPRTIEVRQMHLHFRWAYELATHPRILDAAEDVLGPDLLVWATELFAKHPCDESVSIGWHRDRPYMGFAGPVMTAWVALSDSSAANGCMKAVPRSVDSPGTDDPAPLALDVALRAGEMSLHDPEILHGSGPNRSTEKRVGFVIRFVTPDSRPINGTPPALLVRGQDRGARFSLLQPPGEVDSAETLAAMRASAARHLDAVLGNLRRRER